MHGTREGILLPLQPVPESCRSPIWLDILVMMCLHVVWKAWIAFRASTQNLWWKEWVPWCLSMNLLTAKNHVACKMYVWAARYSDQSYAMSYDFFGAVMLDSCVRDRHSQAVVNKWSLRSSSISAAELLLCQSKANTYTKDITMMLLKITACLWQNTKLSKQVRATWEVFAHFLQWHAAMYFIVTQRGALMPRQHGTTISVPTHKFESRTKGMILWKASSQLISLSSV